MLSDPRLVDRIYEASVMVEAWPDLLQQVADQAGSKGAIIVIRAPGGVQMISSSRTADDVQAFVAEGWADDLGYAAPLFAEQWPGFRAETDYRTEAEIAALPVHAEFIRPRGYFAGVGTVVQGSGDSAIHVALEGFGSFTAARNSLPALNGLRPHLARAVSLTALRGERSQLVTDSLALAGIGAAIVSIDGRLRSANGPFTARMGSRMAEVGGRLRFADPFLTSQIVQALGRHRHGRGSVQSIAVRAEEVAAAFAIHILPVAGAAREACGGDGVLLLIADAANSNIPSADLLRLLFDLTPAEARIARLLAKGGSVAIVSATLGVSEMTVRVHLRAVFAKIGVNRQSGLVRMLDRLGPPTLN